MILREISIEPTYPDNYLHTGFSRETYCVVDLFMRNCKFKNEYPIRKLVISLFSKIEYESFPWSKEFQIQLDTIGEVCLMFDFDRHFKLGDFERRKVLLDTLIEGIKSFATSTGVAFSPFETAFQKCLNADIQNVSLFKTVKSTDRSRIAKIFIETNLKSTSVFAILSDVDDNFKERKTFFEIEPDLLIDKYLLKRAFWTNYDTLRLIGRQEEEFWEVTFGD